jgi:metal-dependent amidase/aminoacylase/carboxypeptidase family protein
MMDEQERPEANEVEMDEQERREVNEADKLYAQAGELYENTVSASRQAGATRREEAEQRRAAEEEAEQQANEAAKQFADAVRASYQAVADRSVSAQALNAQLTQQFFADVINNLRTQAEENRQMTQQLADQQQRQADATRTIAQESVGAYLEFMDSMYSWWLGGIQTAEQGARKTEKAEGRAEREGTEGHKEYFREVIEETNRRAGGKA